MIDLRSDICSQPTAEMRRTFLDAPLDWTTYGEDAGVRELEELGATMLGHQASVLVPSATMANLVAARLLSEEQATVVAESESHVLRHEADGIRLIARLRPVELATSDGRLDPTAVAVAVNEGGLLWLENTHTRAGGTVTSPRATHALVAAAHARGACVHLDGARLPNAAVALGVSIEALAAGADTVTLSLNKGLCAPYGALLGGSRNAITEARVHLRRLGGGTVHKAGLGARAGIIALETMVERLAEDHRRARRLAELVDVDPATVETNIVFVGTKDAPAAVRRLAADGVLVMTRDARRIRLVTHRLIDDADVKAAGAAVRRARR